MQADNSTSKKVSHLVVKMQILHGQSKQSGRSGFGLITFLLTKRAHEHIELIIHVIVELKTSQAGLSPKILSSLDRHHSFAAKSQPFIRISHSHFQGVLGANF